MVFNGIFAGLFGSGGLKRALSAAFAVLLAAVFLVSWFIHTNGYRTAVLRTADDLADAYTAQIMGSFTDFLNVSVNLADSNGTLLRNLSGLDPDRLPAIFAEELASFPMAEIISVGFADGEYAEAQRLADGSIRLGRSGASTGGALALYRSAEGGGASAEVRSEGYDPRSRPWYRDAAVRGRLSFSEPYEILTTGRRAIAALNPIRDADGGILAVTSVTLDLSYFQRTLAAVSDSIGGYVAVYDDDRRLLAASSADHPLQDRIPEISGDGPRRIEIGGEVWRFTSRNYQGKAEATWSIFIALPESRFLAPLAAVRGRIALVYLVTLVIFILLSVLIIRAIGEPLRILRDEVSRFSSVLSEGDIPAYRAESAFLPIIAARKDELGHLAVVFTRLTGDLHRSFSGLKKSLEEKEVLLKEVHHRVKNNLQIISSMLSLHGGALEDPRVDEILEDLRDKVQAMSLVHEVIYSSGNFSAVPMDDYLCRLMHTLSVYNRHNGSVDLAIDIQSVTLPLEKAIPCALVVVELATNAFKYAFSGRKGGTVRVSLQRRGGAMELCIGDDGIGMEDTDKSEGMGMTIVKALVQQLKGEQALSTGPEGTVVRIIFPE